MATYKKRPTKKAKNQVENIEKDSTTAEVFNTLDQTASKSESFVMKYQNAILYGIGIIAVVILGTIGYKQFILEPKESAAADELAFPKTYFNEAVNAQNPDSLLTLGLNGANGKYGFIDIAEYYNGTKAANLANYYAGVSYMKMKDYQEAISYLSKFSSDDLLLEAEAKSLIGDAFADIDQLSDALDYYEKAALVMPNEAMTPLYLMKAGKTALALKKYSTAEKHFEQVKNEYPNSDMAVDIDMYINMAKFSK